MTLFLVCVSSKNATPQDTPSPEQRTALQTLTQGVFVERLNEEMHSLLPGASPKLAPDKGKNQTLEKQHLFLPYQLVPQLWWI